MSKPNEEATENAGKEQEEEDLPDEDDVNI